jgi:hypothetical protein
LPRWLNSASSSVALSKWSSIARLPRPVMKIISVMPGGDGFLHRVLDERLVDDRHHLLRARLRCRQEARAHARTGNTAL